MSGQISADAAVLYERFFVPALFEQWPERVLQTATVGPGHRVLDVGCGTGVLARRALAAVGSSGQVEGVDVNEGMLAVARSLEPQVRWTLAPAEDLPADTGSQDRVLSQFALMFFADPEAAVQEMARVLRPGGEVCIATWAHVDASPGYAAMVALVRRLVGDDAAQALRAPFSVGRTEQLRALVGTAFPNVTVRQVHGVARFPSLDAWVQTEIRAWTLRDLLDDAQFESLRHEAQDALARFCAADGSVTFAVPALIAHAGR